ncbi:uncharacterized protein I303_102027 [Kwoniella dejecticola CBS 10117]|uniref:Uncharacterized protein n=1 Tax=Kwoniella dejecticola CBS 10117 TaxID=1296121 RepID=A0A1A6AC30_9TREE|nr:uncharacterized protein I303_01834 [Kwoniella dejecticola CBS 10117]OBR87626.1 hypothetical protein I303_01834 [Kwoniella dejecticola CBS 10117]
MPERPRLHLDFNSPCTPPPIYSPHFASPGSPGSPGSPPTSYSPTSIRTPSRRSSTSSTSSSESSSASSPKTPATPKIIMGAMVFTSEPRSKMKMSYTASGEETEDEECDVGEMSLEVPGIVLTEPPRQPTPRLPSPPPKQVVLLAPCSLPLPSISSSSFSASSESKEAKLSYSSSLTYHEFNQRPSFSNTFIKFLGYPTATPQQQQQVVSVRKKNSAKMLLLMCVMILGCWHLWSTLGLTLGLIEEAALVL